MTFSHPIALFWALLAVPVVLLYLRTHRPPRQVTATGFLWDKVFAEHGSRSAWLRWRQPVSLLLQLVIVALLVLAMAEPSWPWPAPAALVAVVVEWGLFQRRWTC